MNVVADEPSVVVGFSTDGPDGPTLRFLAQDLASLCLLRDLFQQLNVDPECISVLDLAWVVSDGVDHLHVESCPDNVPTSARILRFGPASFEWSGHREDWGYRLLLLESLVDRGFQYLDYETPGDAAVLVELET